MAVIACLYCQLPPCGQMMQPIPLPLSTLQHKPLDQAAWPNDAQWLYAACPVCKQVSAHLKFDLCNFQDLQSRPHVDKDWLRISFRCAQQGCGTPMQFHVLWEPTVTQTTKNELREKLQNGYWTGVSPCGHPISIANEQEVLFDWVRGRMQGYNPADPLWKRI